MACLRETDEWSMRTSHDVERPIVSVPLAGSGRVSEPPSQNAEMRGWFSLSASERTSAVRSVNALGSVPS